MKERILYTIKTRGGKFDRDYIKPYVTKHNVDKETKKLLYVSPRVDFCVYQKKENLNLIIDSSFRGVRIMTLDKSKIEQYKEKLRLYMLEETDEKIKQCKEELEKLEERKLIYEKD